MNSHDEQVAILTREWRRLPRDLQVRLMIEWPAGYWACARLTARAEVAKQIDRDRRRERGWFRWKAQR